MNTQKRLCRLPRTRCRRRLQQGLMGILLISSLLGGCSSIPSHYMDSISKLLDRSNPAQETTLDEPVTPEPTSAEEQAGDQALNVAADQEQRLASESTDAEPLSEASLDTPVTIEQPVPAITENDLWQRIRDGYRINADSDHPRVAAELKWYREHPNYIARVTERAQRYLYHVVETLEAHNIPLEFALLPIVESAYDPFAYSHGRAAGLWQFIPGTARLYRLKDNWWYDGRRDVVASTEAAAKFLNDLQAQFDGDWLLALASYNSGPGRVASAIKKNRGRGKPTDFWSLDLPRETSTYVPRLLAIAKLIADPAAQNAPVQPAVNEPYFSIVSLDSQLDLAKAAELSELDIQEIYKLNPGFNRWATSPTGPHRIVIPTDRAELFQSKLAELPPEQRISWLRYTIKNGDVLGVIAQKHNTSVATLRRVNNIRGNNIRAGDALLIPVASASNEDYALSEAQRLARKQNAPGRDDNLKKIDYQVQAGDSFWKIARKFKVSMRNLASWNGLATRDVLSEGKSLVVWVPAETPAPENLELLPPPSREPMIKKIAYKVRKGDSLSRIASKFKVSIASIKKWNASTLSKYLQPGQKLTLFVDIKDS